MDRAIRRGDPRPREGALEAAIRAPSRAALTPGAPQAKSERERQQHHPGKQDPRGVLRREIARPSGGHHPAAEKKELCRVVARKRAGSRGTVVEKGAGGARATGRDPGGKESPRERGPALDGLRLFAIRMDEPTCPTCRPPPKSPRKARLSTHSIAHTRSSLVTVLPAPWGQRATSFCFRPPVVEPTGQAGQARVHRG